MRISIDTKAKVKVGNLSRGGKDRRKNPLKADDHNHQWTETLVPLGILDVKAGDFSVYFGTSAETSDFIVDCLEKWWKENQKNYANIEELVINLDKGKNPKIYLIEESYEKGVIVKPDELVEFRQFWQASSELPKWDVLIIPPEKPK